jgi:formate dehydrogenase major subunit
VRLRVDGRAVEVEEGGRTPTLLDACREAGARVPTLCFDERVTAVGHCRACMVEADGRLVAACTTPASEGLRIETASARVRDYLRDLGELMLVEATPGGRAAAMLHQWGADGWRYAAAPPPTTRAAGTRDASHPFLRIDLDACIRCRLCVAACAEIQGQFVWAVTGRGAATRVSWGSGEFAATDCVACGACAALCPTGAVSDVDRLREEELSREARARDEVSLREPCGAEASSAPGGTSGAVSRSASDRRVVRTTCAYCGVGCGLEVHVAGNDVVRVEGARTPVGDGHLCVKGRYAHRFARHPDRLRGPLVRRGGVLEPAGWDEAIAVVVREMQRLRGRVGGLSSSRCTNEENYLFQKWMRAGLGTNNVDCCARVCHAPSAAGMRLSFGTGAATNSLADLESADLILVAGSNTTESHPVAGARLKQAVLGGALLVVIDPRRTELAALADVHLQPRPGANVPLLNAMAFVLVEEGLVDRVYVDRFTEGFEGLAEFLRDFAPETVEGVTGVAAEQVRRAARLYGRASRPMQVHGLGMTEHLQGSEGVRLLCNLALLRGAVGREGVGVNPLRGQNNVQGAADMGCQPDLLPGYAPVADRAVRARFAAVWGTEPPADRGKTLPEMIAAIDCGEIAGLFVMGEDLVQTDPDSRRVQERLASLEFLVVQEIFPSETTALAHVVLPGASAFEKDGTFTSGERRLQRVRKALDPVDGARADWDILVALMRATGMPAPYAHPRDVFDEIRRVWPAVAAADDFALDDEGLQWPVTDAAPRGTAILHQGGFARGRAELACVDHVASPSSTEGPLTLITGRVLEHYNSGSMTRRSGTSALVEEDVLELHPLDAKARGILDGDRVAVRSAFGCAEAAARVSADLRPGSVFLSFHFPGTGTNRVTSDVADRLTGCPEYKVTAVEVERVAPPPQRRA